MENAHPSNKFTWVLGRVFYGFCLLVHLVYLVLLVYIAADTTAFCARMGMITLPGLVLAALMTALTMAGGVLALRCTFSALRCGMRSERTRALYSVQGLGMAMQGVYLLLGSVMLFLPFLSDAAALPLQVFTGAFFVVLADVFVLALQFAVIDICKAKPAKSERLQGRALWQQTKKPAVLGLLAAASIAFIFSGERSVTADRTDAFTHFTAVTLEGEAVDEQIFAGHDLTLVNIWATFCGPCLGEMPDLAALHEEYRDRGFQVVGICGDIVDPQTGARYPDLYAQALTLAQQTGADVYTNLDPAGDLMENYILPKVAAYPTSVFVNSKGEQVGDMIVGACSAERWRTEIESRLAMAAP